MGNICTTGDRICEKCDLIGEVHKDVFFTGECWLCKKCHPTAGGKDE